MLISEFFYVAGGICCVLYFTYERDEQAVAKYIADIMRELNQDVEGKPVQRSLEDQLENCETISPHPESERVGLGLTPSKSMESLRAAGEGVNVMLRKVVKSAWDKVDELKRNSLREAIVAKGEEAPLLEKPSSHV